MPRPVVLPKSLAVAWTILILVACWFPGRHLPMPESELPRLLAIDFDKLAHIGLFGGFGLFWALSGPLTRTRTAGILASGLALAVITELGQAIPFVRREPGVADALADLVGVVLGLATAAAIRLAAARLPRNESLAVGAPQSSID